MRKIVRSVFAVCTVVTVFSLLGSDEERKAGDKGRGWSILTVVENGDAMNGFTAFIASPDDDGGKDDDQIQIELGVANPADHSYNTWLESINNDVKRCWPVLLKALFNHRQLDEQNRDYTTTQLKRFSKDNNPIRPYAISPDGEVIAIWYRNDYHFIKPKKRTLEGEVINDPIPPWDMQLVWDLSKSFHRNDYVLITQKNNSAANADPREKLTLAEHIVAQPAYVTAWRLKRSCSLCCGQQEWHGKTFPGAFSMRPRRFFCEAGGRRALLTFKDNNGGDRCEVYNIAPNASNSRPAQALEFASCASISFVSFENKGKRINIELNDGGTQQYNWNARRQIYTLGKFISNFKAK